MYKIIFILCLWPLISFSKNISIGSKAFTESIILGEVAAQIARNHNHTVSHQSGLGGTQLVWKALQRGDIDVYPEYTGTLFQEIFSSKKITTLEALKTELDQLGLAMTEPLGFSNTYAIGVRRRDAEQYRLKRISDLLTVPEVGLGFSHEFMTRAEGWSALRERYQLPHVDVRGMEHEVSYRALSEGAIFATDMYSTDAEIKHYDLVVLDDDRKLFPDYQALFVYRKSLKETHPNFLNDLIALAGGIRQDQMVALNAQAKIEKRSETAVAQAFIAQFFKADVKRHEFSVWDRLWKDTKNHFYLVYVSLFFIILVSIPLGVLGFYKPRFGQLILAVTGVIQTIPSLALLVFMVPLLGIGKAPALVALFLYGMLPVLRNTYTGLKDIPHSSMESARALGLPWWFRLFKVELPLASRSILAGVKTASVITVGAATLGALVGAGGFGEPILMGIRRDDAQLLLMGAVPAALFAILIQALFEFAERWLIPKGLHK